MCAVTVYMKAGQRDDDTKGRDSATPTVAKSKSPPVYHSLVLITMQGLKCKIQEHYQSGALHVAYFDPYLSHGIVKQAQDFRHTNLKYVSQGFSFSYLMFVQMYRILKTSNFQFALMLDFRNLLHCCCRL